MQRLARALLAMFALLLLTTIAAAAAITIAASFAIKVLPIHRAVERATGGNVKKM
jgi:hypothetical protein